MIFRPVLDPALLLILALVGLGLVVGGAVLAPKRERGHWVLRGLVVLLLAAAALRPGWGSVPAKTAPADLEVMLVIDRTTSMSALDWSGDRPRLQGVRRDAADLVAALPAARFTLLSFGKEVRLELPSTGDVALIEETMASIEREQALAGTGSLIDRPLDVVLGLLREGQERRPDRRRVVVLMTDGENTRAAQQRSFAPIDPLTDGGLVLGYGTPEGAPMPLDEERPDLGWVQDPTKGEIAISRIDEENLREVSSEMGAQYLHRTAPGGLQEVAASWKREFVEKVEDGTEVPAKLELTWLLALILLLLALIDLGTHWRRFVQTRRQLA